MKVKRQDIKWFLENITRKAERDGIELTNEYLANELAGYMETNPGCVNMDESNRSGRYYYSTVGYGVYSLLGERYRMGRVEIFDRKVNKEALSFGYSPSYNYYKNGKINTNR